MHLRLSMFFRFFGLVSLICFLDLLAGMTLRSTREQAIAEQVIPDTGEGEDG